MKTRIISGVLGAVIAVLIFLYGNISLSVAVSALILIALFEFHRATGIAQKNKALFFISLLYGVCISLLVSFYYSLKYCNEVNIIYVIVLLCYMVLKHDDVKFSSIGISALGTLYITIFLSHIIMIRHINHGKIYIWLVFLIAWGTDTFAYFCGKAFGRHKLIPKVSPKKTVEGSVGGIIGAAVVTAIFCRVCANVIGLNGSILKAAVLAALASVLSQFGDLCASCIKREHNVKDFGNLIPGHGGVLDRFDSVLIIAPIIYYYIYYWGIIA